MLYRKKPSLPQGQTKGNELLRLQIKLCCSHIAKLISKVGESTWPLEGFLALKEDKNNIEHDPKSPSNCRLTYKPSGRNWAFIISNNKHISQIYIRSFIRETHDAFSN